MTEIPSRPLTAAAPVGSLWTLIYFEIQIEKISRGRGSPQVHFDPPDKPAGREDSEYPSCRAEQLLRELATMTDEVQEVAVRIGINGFRQDRP